MYLFNKDEILTKYNNVNEIINDFIDVRMEYYVKRKEMQVKQMEYLMTLYSNKYKFINELLNDSIDLRKKKSQEIEHILTTKLYDKIDNSYQYLVKMPMDMVNEENIIKLKNEYDSAKKSLDELLSTTPVTMYYEELCELEKSI